jgi:hypothetical protein
MTDTFKIGKVTFTKMRYSYFDFMNLYVEEELKLDTFIVGKTPATTKQINAFDLACDCFASSAAPGTLNPLSKKYYENFFGGMTDYKAYYEDGKKYCEPPDPDVNLMKNIDKDVVALVGKEMALASAKLVPKKIPVPAPTPIAPVSKAMTSSNINFMSSTTVTAKPVFVNPTPEVKAASVSIGGLIAVITEIDDHDPGVYMDLAEAFRHVGFNMEEMLRELSNNCPDSADRNKHISVLLLWIALRGPSVKNIKKIINKEAREVIEKAIDSLKIKKDASGGSKSLTLSRLSNLFVIRLARLRKKLQDLGETISNPKSQSENKISNVCQFSGFACIIPDEEVEMKKEFMNWTMGMALIIKKSEYSKITDSALMTSKKKEITDDAEKYAEIVMSNSFFTNTEKKEKIALLRTEGILSL